MVAIAFWSNAIRVAAESHSSSEHAPDWLETVWKFGTHIELALIAAANAAYFLLGVAMIDSSFPAAWAGWATVAISAVTITWIVVSDLWFQHLILTVPLVLGVALLLES